MAINETKVSEVMNYNFAGNLVSDYMVFAAVFIALLLGLKLFKTYILHHLKKISDRSKTHLDDMILEFINSINWRFFVFVSFFAAAKTLSLHPMVDKLFSYALLIIAVFYGVLFFCRVVDFLIQMHIKKTAENGEDTTATLILGKIAKASTWVIAVLLILSNIGFNITSLIAGLGIGGVAVAFALQNVLEDLFSSFTIYFDKPFKKGDFIIVGQDMGVVKSIGIKSTRLQTLQGQELVISNRELTSTRVNNYKKMEKRRIAFAFGVEYGTSVIRLKLADEIVREIFKNMEMVQLDRVHFKEFGPFSLNFEVVYYLDSNDYNKYMDTQEQINLEIKGQFEKKGISMAFPTQTVYIKKEGKMT